MSHGQSQGLVPPAGSRMQWHPSLLLLQSQVVNHPELPEPPTQDASGDRPKLISH